MDTLRMVREPEARPAGARGTKDCGRPKPERVHRYPTVAMLALYLALAGTARAQNVSPSDYRVPVSRADNLRIDALSLNYVSEGDTTVVQSGAVSVVYKKFYDSLPFAYSLDMFGSANLNKARFIVPGMRDSTETRWVGTVVYDFVPRVKKYTPSEGNVFVFTEPQLRYDKAFGLPGDTTTVRPNVNMTVGLGYGRFINATPLRKAVRIEEFFLDEGILTDRLPKETMIELGQTIEKEKEYRDMYGDRYRNYWFEDMSNIVTKSGMVLGDIGFGVLRMQEVLFQERINDRFYGWEASAGVQFEVLTRLRRQSRNDPSLSIGFRYSRPISWSTQVNTRLAFSTPFSGDFARVYSLTQTTDFIYEFTNRISFTTAHRFEADRREMLKSSSDDDSAVPEITTDTKLSTRITFAFNFFIENKINLQAREEINTVQGEPFRQSLSLLLSYRIF